MRTGDFLAVAKYFLAKHIGRMAQRFYHRRGNPRQTLGENSHLFVFSRFGAQLKSRTQELYARVSVSHKSLFSNRRHEITNFSVLLKLREVHSIGLHLTKIMVKIVLTGNVSRVSHLFAVDMIFLGSDKARKGVQQ